VEPAVVASERAADVVAWVGEPLLLHAASRRPVMVRAAAVGLLGWRVVMVFALMV
jgi:hypothetical protein